ncbi:type II/IV secretion system protein [Candidatus Fermentibacteria bacterium]|nr:type II/IV secretion system protein [Candidatus Fermentibacteria bacterium]
MHHPDRTRGIPRAVALHYSVAPAVPASAEDGVVEVVAAEALVPASVAEIEQLTGVRIRVSGVSREGYQARLAQVYGIGAAAIEEDRASPPPGEAILPPEAGVVRFVDEIIAEAVRRGATDLHLEPSVDGLRIRLRVDGLLQAVQAPHDLTAHDRRIVARIKVMAGLDSTPSTTPRDGAIRRDGRDLRISVLPTAAGEAVHVRILPQWGDFPTVEELGVSPDRGRMLRNLMRMRSGLVVACGPTGSGKSTTLHVLLRTGVPSTEKVITVEDPVEFRIPEAVQVEVSPVLTFADALRAVLRHDPDVILVGEMRDAESARIALQASLTGHLVLTSLHTDDEAQAITRLLTLGMDRPLLAAALRALISQRLVRRGCRACQGTGFSHSSQCEVCRGSGYRGRVGLFRVTMVRALVRQMIEGGSPEEEIREHMDSAGEPSLHAQARRMADEGMTTEAEIARVMGLSMP